MQGSPKISVVLPVFNGGAYLAPAVQSILDQDFKDFELLVLDDGSTDQSLAVLQKFADQDARVRIISRPNRGLVKTLNEGVGLAKGQYIARMDADDIAFPERLRLQAKYMDEHPECVCVGSSVELMDESGRKLTIWPQLQDDDAIQREAMKGHTTICHPSSMIRRSVLIACGGYRSSMYPAEDLDLWLRLGENGKLANLAQVLLRYRMHGASISGLAAKDGRQRVAAKRACDEACIRRGLSEMTFRAHEAWRPDGTSVAQLQNHLQFGWWAFASSEFATAASYGWMAWRRAPTSRSALALLVKSVWRRYT
jgi:glycosyltransferase involved in cell wall biosynthesis